MSSLESFNGKNILITGAGRGIGFQVAKELHNVGANLILHAASDESIKKLRTCFGLTHEYFQADFVQVGELEQTWNTQVKSNLPLDGFVNAVGVRSRRPLNMLPPSHVAEILTANLGSFIEMVRICTQKKNYNKGMRIVSISSISAHSGGAGLTAYAASKAGLEAAVRCLAKELHKKKISINTLICGQVNTEAYSEWVSNSIDGKDKVLDRQFAGLATPEDISKIVLFLLSGESAFMTGASVPADGGFLI